jgi:hypothetical protein
MKDLFLPIISCLYLFLLGCGANKGDSSPQINEPSPAVNKTIETPDYFDLEYQFVGIGGGFEFAITSDVTTSNGGAGKLANTTRTQYFSADNLPTQFAQYDLGGPYLVSITDKKESFQSVFSHVSSSYFSSQAGLVLSHNDSTYDLAEQNTHESSRTLGDSRYELGVEDTSRDVTVIYDRQNHNEIGSFTSSRRETPVHIETITIALGTYRVAKFDYSSAFVYNVNGSSSSETATGSYWIEVSSGQVVKAEKSARVFYSGSDIVYNVKESRELISRQSVMSALSVGDSFNNANTVSLSASVSRQLMPSIEGVLNIEGF